MLGLNSVISVKVNFSLATPIFFLQEDFSFGSFVALSSASRVLG